MADPSHRADSLMRLDQVVFDRLWEDLAGLVCSAALLVRCSKDCRRDLVTVLSDVR